MKLVFLLNGLILGAAVVVSAAGSLGLYVKLQKIGKSPQFSRIGLPGYIVGFCRDCGAAERFSTLCAIVRISEWIALTMAVPFLIMASASKR